MLETCYGHIAANPDRLQSEVRYSKKEQTPGRLSAGSVRQAFEGVLAQLTTQSLPSSA